MSTVDAVESGLQLLAMPEMLERKGRGRIGETWVARLDDGTPVAAKRIVAADETARDLLLEATMRLAGLRHPSLIPVRGACVNGLTVWVVSEFDDGISLRRLLQVARLAPDQAAAVAFSLLSGLKALHEGGVWHGALHAGNVHVSSDGRVRVGDAGLSAGPGGAEVRESSELAAARAVIRDALPSRPDLPGSDTDSLLAALSTSPEGVAAREREPTIGRELAALVARIGGKGSAVRRAPIAAAEDMVRAPAAQPAVGPVRLFQMAVLAVAVLVSLLVAGLGWWLVTGQGRERASAHHYVSPAPTIFSRVSPKPSQPASTPRVTTPLPIPGMAPPSGGGVESVDLSVVRGPCVPGSTCKLSVQVNLAPRSGDEQVDWVLVFFDRCSGLSAEQPGASILAIPEWSFVYQRWWVTMPAGPPLAVIALTTAPARTQSSPLAVGDATSCG